MHRDLKPVNFLLVNKDDDFSLKAIDFGLSIFFKPGVNHAPKNGTDVLLDPLSIGSPTQRSQSVSDMLSSSQDNKTPVSPLEGLLSPSLNSIQPTSSAGAAPVIDLLDGFSSNPPKQENNGTAYPSVVAFESSNLKMVFNFSKLPGNPQTIVIEATFTNLSTNFYSDFIFQFLQLHLDPASGNTLPASGNGSITQTLRVTNGHESIELEGRTRTPKWNWMRCEKNWQLMS